MNETTLIQLKIIVERAVRPVRASIARKRKMREELLAHVTGVFEEESAKLGEERPALEKTEQRFGNATELAGRLQDSVPWSGNVAWFLGNLIGSPVDSMLRRASWLALLTAVFGIVFCAVALLFDQPASPMALRVYVFSLFMLLAGYWFVLIPLIEWLRREVFGSPSWSWRKVAFVAIACLLFLAPGLAFGLIMASMVQIRTSLVELLPLLGLTWAFSAIPLVHLARVADGQVRHYREWAGLEIG